MSYTSSLEVVLAMSHSYIILPKFFSLILVFRFGKESGVGVTGGQNLCYLYL